MSESRGAMRHAPVSGFFHWISDWANPILVKEIRQAFKSRIFLFAFVGLLVACWLVAFFGTTEAGRGLEYFAYGGIFFGRFFLILLGATFVVVPFTTYWNMCAEQQDDTLETLCITTLRARRVVNGKLAGAAAQILFYFTAILPYLAFTSLLNGFRWGVAIAFLLQVLTLSLATATFALALSTLTRQRVFQGLLGLGLIIAILLVYYQFLGGILSGGSNLFRRVPETWDFYGQILLLFAGQVGISLVLREIAVSALTFESDNRSTGIRLTVSILFLLFWGSLPIIVSYAGMGPGNPRSELDFFYVTTTLIVLSVISLFVVSEPLMLSRRIRQQLPRNRAVRTLLAPWLPGASRGYLFVLVHVAALTAILATTQSMGASSPSSSMVPHLYYSTERTYNHIAVLLCYLVIYSGVACLMTQILRSRFSRLRTAELRLGVFITVLAMVLAPHVFDALRNLAGPPDGEFHYWMILSPFFSAILDLGWEAIKVLLMIGGIVVIANVPGISRTLVELWRDARDDRPPAGPAVQKLSPAETHRTESALPKP